MSRYDTVAEPLLVRKTLSGAGTLASSFFNDQLNVGVYNFAGIAGGGAGFNVDNLTFGPTIDGERGERGQLNGVAGVFYGGFNTNIDNNYNNGDGGDTNAIGVAGDDGGDAFIKDSTAADVLRLDGGDGGDDQGANPYARRIAAATPFPGDSTVGKGGDGSRANSDPSGPLAATPGRIGGLYYTKVG